MSLEKKCLLCGTPPKGEPIDVKEEDLSRKERYLCQKCNHEYTVCMIGDEVAFVGGTIKLGPM